MKKSIFVIFLIFIILLTGCRQEKHKPLIMKKTLVNIIMQKNLMVILMVMVLVS